MVPVKTNSNWLPSIFNDFFENEDVYKRQDFGQPQIFVAFCVLPQVASWGKGILSLATAPLGFFTKKSRFREVSATPDIKNITGCGFQDVQKLFYEAIDELRITYR